MKLQTRIFFPLFIIGSFSLVTATVGCKKSNSSSGSGGSNSISATIGGSAWNTTVPTQTIYSNFSSVFEIGGGSVKSGDTTTMAVTIGTPFPLHTPISSDTAEVDLLYSNLHTQAGYDGGAQAGHCLITVTSWDSVNHKIAGTFTGVMYNFTGGTDSLVVTNGNFNTAYSIQ